MTRKDDDHKQVDDEDRTVDRKIKDAILDARNRVEEREDQVFVQSPLDPEIQGISRGDQVQIWETTVNQYLTRIEPLLKSDEIERSNHYYREVKIADRPVYPRDGETPVVHKNETTKEDIQWSLLQSDQLSKLDLVTQSDTFGRGIEPPEEKRFTVTGLKEVIEKPQQVFQWEVALNPDEIGPAKKIARPVVQASLSKDELKLAVRLADEFLQEHAGIGVKMDGGEDHSAIT